MSPEIVMLWILTAFMGALTLGIVVGVATFCWIAFLGIKDEMKGRK